jgi:hypothetical protein
VDVYSKAAEKIIKEQENIIGPLKDHTVKFTGDKVHALESLVEQYRQLFGQTSVEVCKEATRAYFSNLPPQEIPRLLK